MVPSLSRRVVGGAKCSGASNTGVRITATEKRFERERNIESEILLSQVDVCQRACLQRVPSVQHH